MSIAAESKLYGGYGPGGREVFDSPLADSVYLTAIISRPRRKGRQEAGIDRLAFSLWLESVAGTPVCEREDTQLRLLSKISNC